MYYTLYDDWFILFFFCYLRSFGITLWEIMTFGNMPYTGMTNKETMNYVMRGGRLARPNICPEPVYKLMCFCWKTNPQHRPNFEYIRNKLRLFIQVSFYLTIMITRQFINSGMKIDCILYLIILYRIAEHNIMTIKLKVFNFVLFYYMSVIT